MKRMLTREGIDWVENIKDAISYDGQTTTLKKDLEVEGSINANEIDENMSGYQWITDDTAKANGIDVNYAKIVKSGNMLVLTLGASITRNENTVKNPSVGYWIIPKEVAKKITQGATEIDLRTITFHSEVASFKEKSVRLYGEYSLLLQIFNVNDLTIDTKYNFRYEATILLSNNLV